MNICELLTDDYGRAMFVDGEHSAESMLERLSADGGCPFLSMAEGPLGVLRALSVRMGPLELEGTFTLVAAKRVDGEPVMFHWILRGSRNDEKFHDNRPNWVRDRLKGAQGDA